MDAPSDKPTRVLEENGRKRRDMKVGIVVAMRRINKENIKVLDGKCSLKCTKAME